MTNEEFDNTRFGCNDEIVVRRYLSRFIEKVEYVNFERRTINGYQALEIISHIKHSNQ